MAYDPNAMSPLQYAQMLQRNAANMSPNTSGFATGLNALAGYIGGQAEQQARANAPAAPAAPMAPTTSATSNQDPSPSLLGRLLRGDAASTGTGTGTDDDMAPATGWAGVGQGAGQMAQALGRKSDRRLKSEVTRIGALPNGLPVYRYRLERGPFEIGCMADEVAALRPDAVWCGDDGFLRVDYLKAVA